MRILAIDFGERHLGLAVSDELGIIARSLPPFRRSCIEDDLSALQALAAERGVGEIVIGLPRRMDDSLGPEAAKVEEFASLLKERLGLPVHLVDERMSSAYAHRLMTQAGVPTPRKRKKEHGFAAQIILRLFLDRRKAQGR
jgi:putative Holliday junction resolvase